MTSPGENLNANSVTEKLKDGSHLCKAINVLQPGSVRKINESKMAFKMECELNDNDQWNLKDIAIAS